jgi:hypothetical protein
MSAGADWFARQSGARTPASRPPQQYVSPGGLRIPQNAPQQQQPVQNYSHVEDTITGKENFQGILDAAASKGENVSFTKLSRHWKGGEGMRKEGHLRCPNCDSLNIFTRSSIKLMNTKTGQQGSAKPRCFDCGWTEDGMQGDAANWGTS